VAFLHLERRCFVLLTAKYRRAKEPFVGSLPLQGSLGQVDYRRRRPCHGRQAGLVLREKYVVVGVGDLDMQYVRKCQRGSDAFACVVRRVVERRQDTLARQVVRDLLPLLNKVTLNLLAGFPGIHQR